MSSGTINQWILVRRPGYIDFRTGTLLIKGSRCVLEEEPSLIIDKFTFLGLRPANDPSDLISGVAAPEMVLGVKISTYDEIRQ